VISHQANRSLRAVVCLLFFKRVGDITSSQQEGQSRLSGDILCYNAITAGRCRISDTYPSHGQVRKGCGQFTTRARSARVTARLKGKQCTSASLRQGPPLGTRLLKAKGPETHTRGSMHNVPDGGARGDTMRVVGEQQRVLGSTRGLLCLSFMQSTCSRADYRPWVSLTWMSCSSSLQTSATCQLLCKVVTRGRAP
jgi:hypothetical protein